MNGNYKSSKANADKTSARQSTSKTKNTDRKKAKTIKSTGTVKRKTSPAKKQHITVVLVLLLTFYIILNLIFGGFLYFSFNKKPEEAKIYSLQVKLDNKKLAVLDVNEANNAYGLYIPFRSLSLIGDLSIMGDNQSISVIVRPSGDTIECSKDSSLIYINDNAVRLSSPVLFELTDYLLPIEIVEEYMLGIDITYDDNTGVCTLSRETDGEDLSLKISFPTELERTYFPDEYKYYVSTDESDTSADNSN